jgi:hypothetical protein
MQERELPWWTPLNTVLCFVVLAPNTDHWIYRLTQWCERHHFGRPALFYVCERCQRAQASCEREDVESC